MPTLESIDKITPPSALRHRPIAADAVPTEQQSIVTNATSPMVKRASRLRQPETSDDAKITEWKHADDDGTHTGTRTTATMSRHSATPAGARPLPKTPFPKMAGKKSLLSHVHPLLYLGVGMLAALTLLVGLVVVTNWVSNTLDTLRYGYPRTFQIDAYVGHNESAGMPSHFIAINLHGRIEVIELPGGDAAHARIYLGPQLYGPAADLIPVTLSFIDVNGDHRPDMIIHFQGSQVVFINDQGGFRPLRPDERQPVEQFLQHLGQ